MEEDFYNMMFPKEVVQSMRTKSLNHIKIKLSTYNLTKNSPSDTFKFPPAIPILNFNLHKKIHYMIKTALVVSNNHMSYKPPALKLPTKVKNLFNTKTKHKRLMQIENKNHFAFIGSLG